MASIIIQSQELMVLITRHGANVELKDMPGIQAMQNQKLMSTTKDQTKIRIF